MMVCHLLHYNVECMSVCYRVKGQRSSNHRKLTKVFGVGNSYPSLVSQNFDFDFLVNKGISLGKTYLP